MEKYKKFTDAATGINPFIQPAAPSVFRYLFAVPLLPVVLLVLLFGELIIVSLETLHALSALLGLSGALRILSIPLMYAVTRAQLLCLYTGTVKYSVSPASGKETDLPTLQNGDVVIVNLQSPLDVLALLATFPGTHFMYVFPAPLKETSQWAKSWTLHRYAAFAKIASGAPQRVQDNAVIAPHIDLSGLQRQAKTLGRVVCFFAEGTTSNGRGVLQLPYGLQMDGQPTIVGLTYSCDGVVTSTPVSLFKYVWRTVAITAMHWNRVDVTALRPSTVPPAPSSEASREWSLSIQHGVAKAASFQRLTHKSCKPLARTVLEKPDFIEQWKSYA